MAPEVTVRLLFSTNLKRVRQNMGLSQLALANKLGMAHNFINDIENGKKWVSPETIDKFCMALNVQPYQFFIAENDAAADKDAAIAACCEEILEATKKTIAEAKQRHLGG